MQTRDTERNENDQSLGSPRKLGRRAFVWMAGVSAGAAILAACGDSGSAVPTPTGGATSGSAATVASKPAAAASPTVAVTSGSAAAATGTPTGVAATMSGATTGAAATMSSPSVAPASAIAPSGGTLRIGHISNPSQLDPQRSPAGYDRHIQFAIYDTLVGFDRDLKLQPALALSWDSNDLVVWTFKLRQGIKFHDGTDFNAQAVKANIERVKDPATKSGFFGLFQVIKTVDAVDPNTVRITLNEPSSSLPVLLAEKGGMMISPTAIQKGGADYGITSAVGTGPFQFVEWKQNDHITLKKFPGYWKPNIPGVDQLNIAIIVDDNVRLANLKSGQLDVAHSLAPKDLDSVRKDKNFTLLEGPGIAYWHIQMNGSRPPFDNVALRQAVAYSLDRDAVLQAAAVGSGQIATTPITPAFKEYYDPALKPLPRDLAKAKQKLQEGGKPNGFEFELITANLSVFQTAAQVVQAQLAEAGIKANVTTLDDSTLAQKFITDFQAGVTIYTGRVAIDLTLSAQFDPEQTNPKGRYNVPEATDLIRKARQTNDLPARQKLFNQLGGVIVNQVMDIPLIYPNTNVAFTPKVQNFPLWGDGIMRWDEVTLAK